MKSLRNQFLSLSFAVLGLVLAASASPTAVAQELIPEGEVIVIEEPPKEIETELNCEAEAAKWLSEELQRIAQNAIMTSEQKKAARDKARATFSLWLEKCQGAGLNCEAEAAKWLATEMLRIAEDDTVAPEDKWKYRDHALLQFLLLLEKCREGCDPLVEKCL